MEKWIFLMLFSMAIADKSDTGKKIRDSKLLPVFQIVRFPNDPCNAGGSKNGTCYTAEECSSRGGTNSGSCAEGFGVCCVFTVGCGSMSSENCTYVELSNAMAGGCTSTICKCRSDICQIRLDFNTFVISGPSTSTVSIGHALHGILIGQAGGVAVAEATQCLTDTFTVGNQNTLPVICGTNTGEHVYFEASSACNPLNFQFGQAAIGLTSVATRMISIKVTQYSCNYDNLAPSGCDQWFFGTAAMNLVKTFNFDGGRHLADQRQSICVRREINMCRICWSTDDAKADFQLALDTDNTKGVTKGNLCCSYDADGKGISNKGAFECVMIPGAITAGTPEVVKKDQVCGNKKGLVTATNGDAKTICSRNMPFRVEFLSDSYEMTGAAKDEATGANAGFRLRYFQTGC